MPLDRYFGASTQGLFVLYVVLLASLGYGRGLGGSAAMPRGIRSSLFPYIFVRYFVTLQENYPISRSGIIIWENDKRK